MTMRDPAHFTDLRKAIIAVIADTFDTDPAKIGPNTTADDIDGWDSLGHTVLMTRLSRRLGLPIGEDIASSAETVDKLIEMLVALKARMAVTPEEDDPMSFKAISGDG
jgi:acyl carrier protein